MRPPFFANKPADGALVNSVDVGKLGLRVASFFVVCSNCFYLGLGQFMSWVGFSKHTIYKQSPLISGVRHVFTMRSRPKMFWINTGWIITAGAIMANFLALWNWSHVNHPRQSSDGYRSCCFFSPVDITVTSMVGSCPDPASLGFNHVLPESPFYSFSESLLSSNIGRKFALHNSVCLICATLSDTHISREHFCIMAQGINKSTV